MWIERTGWVFAALLAASPARAAEAPAGQLTRPPELIEFVEADYPAEALSARQSGEVVLRLTLAADGAVSAVTVQAPAGHGFDAAAVAAARRFRFRPAEVDGAPAPVQITYRYAFTLSPEAPAPPPAEITAVPVGALAGVLLEAGTRAPLVAVSVRVQAGGAPLGETVTDAAGRFQLDEVPAGPVVVVVQAPEYAALEDEEQVLEGQLTTVRYYLAKTGFDGDTVTVVGRRPNKQVTRRSLTLGEIRTVPGTQGDALKVIQNLPGAARVAPFGEQLVLRGGGHTEAFIDRHSVPTSFHFGGLRSAVDSGLIESLDVYPGNYGAELGNANGGAVDLRIRRPADDAIHGYVQVDVFDASAAIEGPVGEHGSLSVGARRSYVDAILPLALSEEDLKTFRTAPRYADAHVVYDYDGPDHHLRLQTFGSADEMVLLFDEPSENDPGFRGGLDLSESWVHTQAQWDTRLADDLEQHLSLSHLYNHTAQTVGPRFSVTFEAHGVIGREDLSLRASEALTLRAGLEVDLLWLDYDVTAPSPPKEGEPQLPFSANELLYSRGTMFQARPAVWAEAQWTLGDLLLVPGLRVQLFEQLDEVVAMPRLTARYALTGRTTLKGGVGLFSETPKVDELEAVFGNPDLKAERSWHYSAGVEQRFTDHLSLDATGFYKDFDRLVVGDDDPRVAFTNGGEGRAYGLELLLRHQGDERLYGWIAYTLMRSERQAPGGDHRPFDLDQTHNLTVVAQYKLTTTWEVGGRFRFVTGNPSTPWVGRTFDSDADAFIPVAGAPNSERNDDFHQLDLRVDKHWVFDTWRMTTYLEAQNVYNRANAEGYTYNYDYTEREVSAGLPFVPSFGVRGAF